MDATATAAKSEQLDLDVVHGLMEDAIYGGRVDNPYDGRVLKAYLRKLFTRDAVDGRAPLCRGLSVPRPCTYEAAVAAVSALPDNDAPTLFGLPDNIERSVQRTQSARVSEQLRQLTLSGGIDECFDRDAPATRRAPAPVRDPAARKRKTRRRGLACQACAAPRAVEAAHRNVSGAHRRRRGRAA